MTRAIQRAPGEERHLGVADAYEAIDKAVLIAAHQIHNAGGRVTEHAAVRKAGVPGRSGMRAVSRLKDCGAWLWPMRTDGHRRERAMVWPDPPEAVLKATEAAAAAIRSERLARMRASDADPHYAGTYVRRAHRYHGGAQR